MGEIERCVRGEGFRAGRRHHGARLVQRLFHRDPGPPGGHPFGKGPDQPRARRGQGGCRRMIEVGEEQDFETGCPEPGGPPADDTGIGIGVPDHHSFGGRAQDCFGAGRRAANMIARLQRHNDRMNAIGQTFAAAGLQRLRFGMRLAGFGMRLAGEQGARFVQNRAADRRIGRGGARKRLGARQGKAERIGDGRHALRVFTVRKYLFQTHRP